MVADLQPDYSSAHDSASFIKRRAIRTQMAQSRLEETPPTGQKAQREKSGKHPQDIRHEPQTLVLSLTLEIAHIMNRELSVSYYFTLDGKDVQGPTTLQQIAEWVRQSKLPPTVYVCEAGGQEWKQLTAVVPAIQLAPPSGAAAAAQTAAAPTAIAQTAEPTAQTEHSATATQSSTASSVTSEAAQSSASVAPTSSPASSASQAAAERPTEPTAQPEAGSRALARRETNTALAGSSTSAGNASSTGSATLASATVSDFSGLVISSSRPVDAKSKKSKGTGLHTFVGYAVVAPFLFLFALGLTITTYGAILLIVGISYWLTVRRGHAQIHGGSVHVNEDQFPEIHRCAQQFADRLRMKSVPEVYVVEGSVINAFAAKLGKRKYILLLDEVVHGCLETGDSRALAFIIGHEMAHHALGHTGLLRSSISSTYKALSRCDELTCDAIAADLVENPQVSKLGLAMLLVGPQLVRMLNWRALDRQARELLSKKTWKGAESSLTHPLLLRRYAAITGLQ